MENLNFTGVILAGGASRRMGTDKASLRVQGLTLLTVMKQKLVEAGASKVAVLGRENMTDGIVDQCPGAGPVVAVLDYLKNQPLGSRHLIVPVDMPALAPADLALLGAQRYWAFFSGHNLPFLAVADAIELMPSRRIRDLLFIKMARQLELPQGREASFANLNTPSDFAAFSNQSLANSG